MRLAHSVLISEFLLNYLNVSAVYLFQLNVMRNGACDLSISSEGPNDVIKDSTISCIVIE